MVIHYYTISVMLGRRTFSCRMIERMVLLSKMLTGAIHLITESHEIHFSCRSFPLEFAIKVYVYHAPQARGFWPF